MSRRKLKKEKLAKARRILAGIKKPKISVKTLEQKIEKKQREHRHAKGHMFGRGIGIIGVIVLVLIYSLVA
jgi:tetrahydromethanopterin S-methyltransferase subunit G